MADYFISLALFWSIWLLIPILIDMMTAVANLVGGIMVRRRRFLSQQPLEYFPMVSIIVPVYNSAETLGPCLRSIAEQDYPHARLEVLLINNGSTDNSFQVFSELQGELDLRMGWHSVINQGKAWALNAGIHIANAHYIVHVDSDVVLAPDAIRRVIEAMESDTSLGAVTGAIEVLPPPTTATSLQRTLAGCEFFEYLTAFRVGRQFQTVIGNLFTLSGAFTAFRREVLLQTFLYSQATVTEDTDLTFDLHERVPTYRLGCVSDAVAYTLPTESLSALYAQRVRWQRGQIEVCARHRGLLRRPLWQLRGFSPARGLVVDHTIAFPRVTWTFLLPILVFFGYPLSLVITAALVLYVCYLLLDLVWIVVAGLQADPKTRRRLLHAWQLIPIMPLYRMLVYWFRISGFLHALAEPGVWRVDDPLSQVREGLFDLQRRLLLCRRVALSYLENMMGQ